MGRPARHITRRVSIETLEELGVLTDRIGSVYDDDIGDVMMYFPRASGWLDDIITGVCRLDDRKQGRTPIKYQRLLQCWMMIPLGHTVSTIDITRMMDVPVTTGRRYAVAVAVLEMIVARLIPERFLISVGETILSDADIDKVMMLVRK